jgi:hypothetical protein
MKNTILAFLVSRGGSIATPIIAAGIAWIVAKLAMLSPELAGQVNQVEVAAFVWGLIVAAVNYATNAGQTDGTKAIQQAASEVQKAAPNLSFGQRAVNVDGIPGPITVKTVTDLLGKLIKQ